jgi:hypothetical protein
MHDDPRWGGYYCGLLATTRLNNGKEKVVLLTTKMNKCLGGINILHGSKAQI